jgi:hypothetical protein
MVGTAKKKADAPLDAATCSAWVSVDQRPPIIEDYGCFFHSIDVLFTDGVDQWVGYLQTWEDEEYEPMWKMKGPDGWGVKNVTHWMILPFVPNKNF